MAAERPADSWKYPGVPSRSYQGEGGRIRFVRGENAGHEFR